ncbi:MAG: response regulator transcription factor [Nitrospira sp.]|nr:response regulator transcription factor [Nitrospira sp.]
MERLPNTVVQKRRSTEVPKRVRVLLVDGSIITLHGLKSYLSESDHIIVVGTARTERAALTALKICQPDVVVLGVHVGRASGIDICRVMRESYPKIAVLVFSEYDDKHVLQSAILAGAHGYLLKIASREALVKSIELVATGR